MTTTQEWRNLTCIPAVRPENLARCRASSGAPYDQVWRVKIKFPERMGTLCRTVERRSLNGRATILVEFKADKFAVFAPDTYVQCAATYKGKMLEGVINSALEANTCAPEGEA